MQKVFLRLLLLTLSVCLFSCQSNRLEDDVDILEPTVGTGKTYTMYLDATYPSFVGNDADATTRAQNNSWENGDVIYISFTDGNTHKIGEGKYNSSTGKWTVKLDSGSLSEREKYPCSIYYLCDGTVSRSGANISLDESTSVYADLDANYSVTQDEIVLSASLKSQTWRMAFKGEAGTEVTVQPESSIRYINKIDMSGTGSSSLQYSNDKAIDLTVQSTGKTPYIYGVFDSNGNNTSSTLSLTTNQFPYHQFSRSITHQSLKNGESGIVTLPTSTSNDDKWTSTIIEDVAILMDGKEFNSVIKTLAAGRDQSYIDAAYSIEFIVFEINSTISNGTIISSPDSPREIFANYSSSSKTITISTQADKFELPTDMSHMFYTCSSLQTLDLSYFDTRNVTDMSSMFYWCSSLQTLDVSNFDTRNVTDMGSMFSDCTSLQTLDVSNFDTRNVTDMRNMFGGCVSLKTLDLSNFETHNVTLMGYMFCGCSSLQTLDVSNFDTRDVTSMWYMFCDCTSLQTLDISNFDTRNVISMYFMFSDCTSLQTLDVSNFDTRNVTSMGYMFCGCSSLQTLDISNFDTRNVAHMGDMFGECSSLQTLDVSSLDTRNVTSMFEMFCYCSSLQTLDVSNFDTHNVTSMGGMFKNCSSLQTLDVSNFDTRNVTDMGTMFSKCSSLQTLDVSNFDTHNVTEMRGLFRECSSLQTLNVSNFDTQNVENMTRMFDGCLALQSLNISNFDTRNVRSMEAMFSSCLQLKKLDLSGFQTNNVTSMRDMFENCQRLETLNLDGFSTESLTEIHGMFYQCFALQKLYLGTSFILDKSVSYDNYYNIVDGLAMDSKKCRISCPAVTKEFFLWMDIESKYIEWEILD